MHFWKKSVCVKKILIEGGLHWRSHSIPLRPSARVLINTVSVLCCLSSAVKWCNSLWCGVLKTESRQTPVPRYGHHLLKGGPEGLRTKVCNCLRHSINTAKCSCALVSYLTNNKDNVFWLARFDRSMEHDVCGYHRATLYIVLHEPATHCSVVERDSANAYAWNYQRTLLELFVYLKCFKLFFSMFVYHS